MTHEKHYRGVHYALYGIGPLEGSKDKLFGIYPFYCQLLAYANGKGNEKFEHFLNDVARHSTPHTSLWTIAREMDLVDPECEWQDLSRDAKLMFRAACEVIRTVHTGELIYADLGGKS